MEISLHCRLVCSFLQLGQQIKCLSLDGVLPTQAHAVNGSTELGTCNGTHHSVRTDVERQVSLMLSVPARHSRGLIRAAARAVR